MPAHAQKETQSRNYNQVHVGSTKNRGGSSRFSGRVLLAACGLAVGLLAPSVTMGQTCQVGWIAADPSRNALLGFAEAMAFWDPDGSGPATGRLVLSVPESPLWQFSPDAGGWVNIPGWSGRATDVKPLRSGGLVIAGNGRADGEVASAAGVWLMERGTVRRLGGIPNASVSRISITNEGEIVVGGGFTSIGSNPVRRVARWDGAEWLGFGEGPVASVTSLLAELRDSIIVGGSGINGTAEWNGTTWTGLGNFNKPPTDFLRTPEGDLLAVGHVGTGLNNVVLGGDVIR